MIAHPLFRDGPDLEDTPQPVIRYAPACGVCLPYVFLVYDGANVMHCPACQQVYSCLVPPVNYLDVLELTL